MINAKELHKQLTSLELTRDEINILDELEQKTDQILTAFFLKHTYAFVKTSDFNSILTDIHQLRRQVILHKWQKSYEANSWNIKYDNDMDPGWHFTIETN